MGNDTGGAISQLVALDHGERVGRLVLTNCDCFEVFPPKEFVPMVKAARVPGALFAAVQPMRSAKARRSPMAYGRLAHDLPDELTGAWVAAVPRQTPTSAATPPPSCARSTRRRCSTPRRACRR